MTVLYPSNKEVTVVFCKNSIILNLLSKYNIFVGILFYYHISAHKLTNIFPIDTTNLLFINNTR